MFSLDRLDILSAISFIKPAIPKKSETGMNCLFVRVDEGKITLIGGNQFVVKQVVLARPIMTTDENPGKEVVLPKTFMIPRADIMAFKEMMEEHKVECKMLSKNDPSYLFVDIDEGKLTSLDADITYPQPKYEFKDLDPIFQITRGTVSDIPVMSGDISSAVFGFKKSEKIDITFTGEQGPILFEQEDYKAILIPPVEVDEKEEDKGISEGQQEIKE